MSQSQFTKSSIALTLKKCITEMNEKPGVELKAGPLKTSSYPQADYIATIESQALPRINFVLEFKVQESQVCFARITEDGLLSLLLNINKDIDSLEFDIKKLLELFVVSRGIPLLPNLLVLTQSKLRWIFEGFCNIEIVDGPYQNCLKISRMTKEEPVVYVHFYGDSQIRYSEPTDERQMTSGWADILKFEYLKGHYSPDNFADWYSSQIYVLILRKLFNNMASVSKESAKRMKKIYRAIPSDLKIYS